MLYEVITDFQHDIDKQNNAKTLSENINWKKTEEGLIIAFPENLLTNNISGKVFLYRPRITSYNVCYTKLLRDASSFYHLSGDTGGGRLADAFLQCIATRGRRGRVEQVGLPLRIVRTKSC